METGCHGYSEELTAHGGKEKFWYKNAQHGSKLLYSDDFFTLAPEIFKIFSVTKLTGQGTS